MVQGLVNLTLVSIGLIVSVALLALMGFVALSCAAVILFALI